MDRCLLNQVVSLIRLNAARPSAVQVNVVAPLTRLFQLLRWLGICTTNAGLSVGLWVTFYAEMLLLREPLSVCPSLCLYARLSFYLSVCLVCPSGWFYMWAHPSFHLTVCLFNHLSSWVCVSAISMVNMSVPLTLRLSVCLSLLHSVCPFVWKCVSLYNSLSLFESVCQLTCIFLSVYLSVPHFVCLFACLSVRLSVCPTVCLSNCQSVWLSDFLSVQMSVCPPGCLSACLFDWLLLIWISTYHSICLFRLPLEDLSPCMLWYLTLWEFFFLSVCLSVHPSIHL